MGAFPFTTIEPNTGVTYYRTPCASVSRGKANLCRPRHGFFRANDGTRFIPVRLLDVAGLVPGASQGLGLGNKFLNDLCGADVLIHVIDVSGTTNEKGEATVGYDPVNDAEWLIGELTEWCVSKRKRKKKREGESEVGRSSVREKKMTHNYVMGRHEGGETLGLAVLFSSSCCPVGDQFCSLIFFRDSSSPPPPPLSALHFFF